MEWGEKGVEGKGMKAKGVKRKGVKGKRVERKVVEEKKKGWKEKGWQEEDFKIQLKKLYFRQENLHFDKYFFRVTVDSACSRFRALLLFILFATKDNTLRKYNSFSQISDEHKL